MKIKITSVCFFAIGILAFLMIIALSNEVDGAVVGYDYSTSNQGMDSWAYRFEVSSQPPVVNNDPSIEFTSIQYNNVEAVNGTYQTCTATASSGNYASHRFVFNIQTYPVLNNLTVWYRGQGTSVGGNNGFYFYVWNATSTSYEQLFTTTSSSYQDVHWYTTLCNHYVDGNSNVTFLSVANAKAVGGITSTLSSDYILINTTKNATKNLDTGIEYSTIQDAINSSSSGETILVFPGIHQEYLVINKSLHLKGYSWTNTTIDGSLGSHTDNYLIQIQNNDTNIENLEIRNANAGFSQSKNIYIQNLSGYELDNITIHHSYIHSTYNYNIHSQSVSNFSMHDCNLSYASQNTNFQGRIIDSEIYDCEFYAGNNGIFLNGSYRSSIHDLDLKKFSGAGGNFLEIGGNNNSIYNINMSEGLSWTGYGLWAKGVDNQFYNMNIDHVWIGVYLQGASDNEFWDIHMTNCSQGLYIWSNAVYDDPTFTNCSISNTTNWDINILSNPRGSVQLWNFTFNESKVAFQSSQFTLKVGWFVNCHVNDSQGDSFNARVRLYDNTTRLFQYEDWITNTSTNPTGDSNWIKAYDYWQENTGKTYYSPHRVLVTNKTHHGLGTATFSSNAQIFITINISSPIENIDTSERFVILQDAIDSVNTTNGHTLVVQNGTYQDRAIVNKSLTIQGFDRTNTSIDCKQTPYLFKVESDWVNISHFTLHNTTQSNTGTLIYNTGNNTNASYCNFTDTYWGVFSYQSSYISIYDNLFYDSTYSIILNSSTNNGEVISNTFTSTGIRCLNLKQTSTYSENHTVFWNSFDNTLYMEESGNNTIHNNTFSAGGIAMLEYNTHTHANYSNTNRIDSTNTINSDPIYYYANTQDITVPTDAGQVLISNCTNITLDSLIMEEYDFETIQIYYSDNVTIENVFLRNSTNNGIRIHHSRDIVIADSDVNISSSYGIYTEYLYYSTMLNTSCSAFSGGFYIRWSGHIYCEDSDFWAISNGIVVNTSSHNLTFESCIFTGASAGFGMYFSGSKDIYANNCTFNGGTWDIRMIDFSGQKVVITNGTMNQSKVSVLGVCSLDIYWWMNIRVRDHLSNPYPNASIWINDSASSNVFYNLTDANANALWTPLQERTLGTGASVFTPHTVVVLDIGNPYIPIYNESWNMIQSRDLRIVLTPHWNVTTNTTVSDQSITICNITVQPDVKLTIINSTIYLPCSYPYSCNVIGFGEIELDGCHVGTNCISRGEFYDNTLLINSTFSGFNIWVIDNDNFTAINCTFKESYSRGYGDYSINIENSTATMYEISILTTEGGIKLNNSDLTIDGITENNTIYYGIYSINSTVTVESGDFRNMNNWMYTQDSTVLLNDINVDAVFIAYQRGGILYAQNSTFSTVEGYTRSSSMTLQGKAIFESSIIDSPDRSGIRGYNADVLFVDTALITSANTHSFELVDSNVLMINDYNVGGAVLDNSNIGVGYTVEVQTVQTESPTLTRAVSGFIDVDYAEGGNVGSLVTNESRGGESLGLLLGGSINLTYTFEIPTFVKATYSESDIETSYYKLTGSDGSRSITKLLDPAFTRSLVFNFGAFELTLEEGWNTMTIPTANFREPVQDFVNQTLIERILAYNTTSKKFENIYIKGVLAEGYVESGQAYYVYVRDPELIRFYGSNRLITVTEVKSGWNFLGITSDITVNQILSQSDDIVTLTFQKDGEYVTYKNILEVDVIIPSGSALFLYADKTIEVVI